MGKRGLACITATAATLTVAASTSAATQLPIPMLASDLVKLYDNNRNARIDRADAPGSGRESTYIFAIVKRNSGRAATAADLRRMLSRYDTNKDGSLTIAQYRTFVTSLEPPRRKR